MKAHTDIAVAFTETEAVIVEKCVELVVLTMQRNPVVQADWNAVDELNRIRDKITSARLA